MRCALLVCLVFSSLYGCAGTQPKGVIKITVTEKPGPTVTKKCVPADVPDELLY